MGWSDTLYLDFFEGIGLGKDDAQSVVARDLHARGLVRGQCIAAHVYRFYSKGARWGEVVRMGRQTPISSLEDMSRSLS